MQRWTMAVLLLGACGPSVAGHEGTGSTDVDDGAGDDTNATTMPSTTTPSTTSASTATTTGATTIADTGASTTSTGGAESLDGNTFLDTFGDEGVAVQCDIWAQDCPRGEKCVPYSYDGSADWSGALCVPIVDDPAAPGDPCTVADDPFGGHDDCAAGTMCWGADPATLAGVCYAQCTGTPVDPQCADGLDCWDGNDVVAACVSTCLPLSPTCADHESCVLDASTQSAFCIPTPLVMGTAYGETCDADALACGTGLACVSADHVPSCMDECCTTLCDFTSPTECPDAASGQTCVPLFDRAPPGFEALGMCGIVSP